MLLKNKIAVITGSSSGIGKSAALTLAKAGAKVVINFRSNKAGAEVVAQEIKKCGGICHIVQADLSDPKQVKKLFTETIKTFGTVDILINNAGLAKPIPFTQTTPIQLEEEFAENYYSFFYSCQEAARIMESKKAGKIINVSSICALTGCTTVIPYSSARAAVISLTQSLAKILAPHIQVNSIAPGFTKTRFWDGMPPDEVKELLDTTLSKKWVTSEEITEALLYLISNESVTGQTLVVDGGYTATL